MIPYTDRLQRVENRTRLPWIDWCRAFAICTVLLCHTTERLYKLSLPDFANYSLAKQIFVLSLFTVGRLGVPIFFMISGYLLLDRTYDFESTCKFYRRNLTGLILTTEIWIVIYNLFNAYFNSEPISVDILIRNMLFLEQTDMSHMWYMSAIIGIYILIPFAANGLRHTDERLLKRIILFAFIELYIIPEISVVYKATQGITLSVILDLSYSGGRYGIYLVAGYFVKKGYFDKIPTALFPVLTVVCYILTVAVQLFSFRNGVEYTVWYNNATIFISTLSAFVFMSRKKELKNSTVIKDLAICAFGIYLIHNPVNMLLVRYIHIGRSSIRLMLIFAVTLAISWGGVHFLSKIKKLGKILFFIK